VDDKTKEIRSANNQFRKECAARVTRSPIPAPVKATLQLILDHIGSASHYTLSWISHKQLAALQSDEVKKVSERTIEWHCKAILASGILTDQKLGATEARRTLKEQFGYEFKAKYLHRLTFWRINRDHPFWAGDKEATQGVVAAMREAVSGRDKDRTRPAANPVAGYAANPVAGDTANPVAGDTANPVAGFGQALLQETAGAVSQPPYPLEERARQEEEGIALRADRGSPSPENVSEHIHTPEISEAVRTLEISLPHSTCFSSSMTLPPESVAPRVAKLWSQWKEELGRYPDPWMVEAVLRSDLFKGIRSLNWGLLTSRSSGKGTPYRDRLYQGVVDQFQRHQIANKVSVRSRHALRAEVRSGFSHS